MPAVVETQPGVYRKNLQIAHIFGIRKGSPRHDLLPPGEDRNSFKYLLLLCLPHHSDIDDPRTGEKEYPPERLLRMKAEREGGHAAALAELGAIGEEELTELLLRVFQRPLDRLNEIADRLERTGEASAATVAELRQVAEVLADAPAKPDSDTVAL